MSDMGKQIKVALVSSFPPVPCGVADYSDRLLESLGDAGVDVRAIRSSNWRWRDGASLLAQIEEFEADIIHLQYPSLPYGTGLAMHSVAARAKRPIVSTVHEFTQVHPLRKLATLPFFVLSDRIIFTTKSERDRVGALVPSISRKSRIVRIGSNVRDPQGPQTIQRSENLALYFGTFRPNKGIEEFLELAGRLMPDKFWRFVLIGAIQEKDRSYYDMVRARSSQVENVEWVVDAHLDEVARWLRSGTYAYLPFPDGASERRGSLLAALGAGLITLTRSGPATTLELARTCAICKDASEAAAVLTELRAAESRRTLLQRRASDYAAAISWPAIAASHAEIYNDMLMRR